MFHSIPIYPKVRDLRFDDKPILNQAFQTHPPQISEYTFTNLFVWQTTHPVQISQLNSSLLILRFNSTLNRMVFLPPIGKDPLVTLVSLLRDHAKNSSPTTLYGLSFHQADALKRAGIEVVALRDNWD